MHSLLHTHHAPRYKSDVAYAGFKAAFVADTWNTQFGAFKALYLRSSSMACILWRFSVPDLGVVFGLVLGE